MNLFVCINNGIKTVHKNYQLLFIHFLFLFVSFFGLFFILSIPLGILFIIFGIDLTDILKESFFDMILSSINLMKKFLIFAVVFLFCLFVYIIMVFMLWVYIFSGTVGIMSQFLQKGITFNSKDFNRYGKQFFWKVAFFTIFSVLIFIFLTFVFGFIGEVSSKITAFLNRYSHAVSVFFNVFFYLSILFASILVFILWITYTLFGFYGIFIKNFSVKEAIKETRKILMLYPQSIGRAALLFITYILMFGVILSFVPMLAVIPHIGTFLAAVYQFVTQFAHIYISMVVFASFLSYYLSIDSFSIKTPEQTETLPSGGSQSQPQSLPPEELS